MNKPALLWFAGAVAVGGLYACHARAQTVCVATDNFLKELSERFGEEPAGAGVTAGGKLIMLTVSPEKGTWTIVITRADGLTCMVASGEGWDVPEPKPVGEPG